MPCSYPTTPSNLHILAVFTITFVQLALSVITAYRSLAQVSQILPVGVRYCSQHCFHVMCCVYNAMCIYVIPVSGPIHLITCSPIVFSRSMFKSLFTLSMYTLLVLPIDVVMPCAFFQSSVYSISDLDPCLFSLTCKLHNAFILAFTLQH